MSEATDAQPAASSPAPSAPAVLPLDAMTSEQRQQWRVTGQRPSPTSDSTDAAAASSSAPAGDQPASTDASLSAASEPAKGKGVKARSAELDAEIAGMRDKLKLRASLREELDRLDRPKDATPAASSPATGPSLTETVQRPDIQQPMLTEEQFFATFPTAAYGQYGVYAARYVVAEDRAQTAQASQQRESQQKWTTSIDAVRAEFPDYDEAVQNFASLQDSPANRAMGAAISESSNARLHYYLATHLDVAKALCAMTPTKALVELGKLDAQISNPQAASRPQPKTVTGAPAPPPSFTSRATVPADDIEAARASGDWRRFRELSNQRDVAAMRR